MSKQLIVRYFYQLSAKISQAVMLAVFVIIYPRLALNASSWAAQYFLSLSLITPIFMFFSFELRKLTSASAEKDIMPMNHRRMAGLVISCIISSLLALSFYLHGTLNNLPLFFSILAFTSINIINDQISANYEWSGNFKGMTKSIVIKTIAFITISLCSTLVFSLEVSIVIGSFASLLLIILYDEPRGATSHNWLYFRNTSILRDNWIAGTGSFLASLTISLPRLFGAFFLGETALNIIGAGQSLNKFGQLFSSAFTQLVISSKNINEVLAKRIAIMIQFIFLVSFIILIPIWKELFTYASQNEMFSNGILVLLVFGFISQLNYLMQSLVLIKHGAKHFLTSPQIFLCVFIVGISAFWLNESLSFWSLLGALIFSRLIQLLMNMRKLND